MIARPVTFWIVLLAVLIALTAILREILLPFVAAMALAYLLDPLASRLERLGFGRLTATLAIMGTFIIGATALVYLSVPIIVRELTDFIENAPLYLKQLRELATDPSRPWLSRIVGEGLGTVEQSFGEVTSLAADWFGAFLHSAWSGGEALLSIFSLSIVAPIAACYLIYDWKKMIEVVDNWVPPTRRTTVRMLAREIDETIGGFARGQGALCLILGVFYALALVLIGLHHGILIGFAAGLISFVPYLGSITGLLVATCVAIAQFWPRWGLIGFVPAIFFIGQSLGDYVLSPYLVGRRVNLNPVWMMFALFAFGYLFGFVGLLIAVPLAAAIGVLLRFAMAQYYASPLYAVEAPAPGKLPSQDIKPV
jgi:predicted PurR-regulated permease PerM